MSVSEFLPDPVPPVPIGGMKLSNDVDERWFGRALVALMPGARSTVLHSRRSSGTWRRRGEPT